MRRIFWMAHMLTHQCVRKSTSLWTTFLVRTARLELRTYIFSVMLDFQILFSRSFMQLCANPIWHRISPLLPPMESIVLPRLTKESTTSTSPSATCTVKHVAVLQNWTIFVLDQLMWSPKLKMAQIYLGFPPLLVSTVTYGNCTFRCITNYLS